MGSILSTFHPETTPPGLLPKWMILVGIISLANTLQSYLTLSFTKRVYSGPASSASPLSSRTFGTWTALTGIVRLFAASRLNEQTWYDLAWATYFVALTHFGLEIAVYRSARFPEGTWPSICVAVGSVVWMGIVREGYIGV